MVAKLKDSGVSWFEHEPIDLCSVEPELGAMLEIENGIRLIPNFNKSAKILSLDSDFLGKAQRKAQTCCGRIRDFRKNALPKN